MLLNGTADDLLTLGLSPVSNVFFLHKIKETERREQREICMYQLSEDEIELAAMGL